MAARLRTCSRSEGIAVDAARLEAALHPAKRRYPERLARGGSHLDGWSLLMLDLLELSGVAGEVARAALPALKRAHFDFNFWRRVPADLIAGLERARTAGLRLGVVSNSEGRLRHVLDRVGLVAAFRTGAGLAARGRAQARSGDLPARARAHGRRARRCAVRRRHSRGRRARRTQRRHGGRIDRRVRSLRGSPGVAAHAVGTCVRSTRCSRRCRSVSAVFAPVGKVVHGRADPVPDEQGRDPGSQETDL